MHGEMRQSMSPGLRDRDSSGGGNTTCAPASKSDSDPSRDTSQETAPTPTRLSFGIDQILDHKAPQARTKSDSSSALWKPDCQGNNSSSRCPPVHEDGEKKCDCDDDEDDKHRHHAHCNYGQTQNGVPSKLSPRYSSEALDILHQSSHSSNPDLPAPYPFCARLRLSGSSASVASGPLSTTSSLTSGHFNSYALDVVSRLRSEAGWGGPGLQSVDNFEYRGMGGHHSFVEHPLFSWSGAQRDRFGGECLWYFVSFYLTVSLTNQNTQGVKLNMGVFV